MEVEMKILEYKIKRYSLVIVLQILLQRTWEFITCTWAEKIWINESVIITMRQFVIIQGQSGKWEA